jgi:hypothetical protein
VSHILYSSTVGSVAEPDLAFFCQCGPTSRDLMTNNCKILLVEKEINYFLTKNYQIHIPRLPRMSKLQEKPAAFKREYLCR